MSRLNRFLLAAIISLIGTAVFAQQQPTAEQQQLYMQMLQTQQQLQQLQEQAFATDNALAAQRDELISAIDTQMVAIDSAAEALITRRDELIAILEAGVSNPDADQRPTIAEYQGIMEQLQVAQQQALQNSEIQSMQMALQEAAVLVMAEINPEVDAIIDRFNELRDQMMQLQGQ